MHYNRRLFKLNYGIRLLIMIHDLLNRPRVPLTPASLSRDMHHVKYLSDFPVTVALISQGPHLFNVLLLFLMGDLVTSGDFLTVGQAKPRPFFNAMPAQL